jgi:early secretory antigenic target protein ESAT-6
MGQMTYNFAGIEGSAGDLHGAVQRTQGLLDEGQGSLARLAAAWQGGASMTYQDAQMRWDTNSAELNAALQSLAHAVSEAGTTMAQTEAGVTGMFA